MTEAAGPGDAFAIGDDTQYQPVAATGDLRVPVSGREGTGLLACHASGPLGRPRRGPVVIVVHGALRDSDRYLAGARHAARLAASDALIVAPQFLADVDRAVVDGWAWTGLMARCTGGSRGGRAVTRRWGRLLSARSASWTACSPGWPRNPGPTRRWWCSATRRAASS
jgi:hypothetical protein